MTYYNFPTTDILCCHLACLLFCRWRFASKGQDSLAESLKTASEFRVEPLRTGIGQRACSISPNCIAHKQYIIILHYPGWFVFNSFYATSRQYYSYRTVTVLPMALTQFKQMLLYLFWFINLTLGVSLQSVNSVLSVNDSS